jgi:hypothetical protein
VLVAGLAGQAREVRAPGGTFELERKISLDCYIDNNHMLNVGSVHAIRKGTRIWFVAKLENAGRYTRSILLPSDIPPHLYVTIFNLPLLDIGGLSSVVDPAPSRGAGALIIWRRPVWFLGWSQTGTAARAGRYLRSCVSVMGQSRRFNRAAITRSRRRRWSWRWIGS